MIVRAFVLLLVFAACAPVSAAAPVVEAGGGELLIEPKHDLLEALGVRLPERGAGALRLPLETALPLSLELGDGGPTAVRGGWLWIPGLQLRHRDGRRSPELALVPARGRALGLDIVDGRGRVWLRIEHAMRSPSLVDGFRLHTAALRVGPALAEWSGTDGEGLLAGRVELAVPLLLPGAAAKAQQTCLGRAVAWKWPTLGYAVDVQLIGIDTVTPLRCRILGSGAGCGSSAFSCDGPGGQEGEVVFVPDARLRNSDSEQTADVPWFRKFTGPFEPYDNDQHPYLVWNLYRLDADGRLLQLARSGLKHAFATANETCSAAATCRFNTQVLGRGCSDLYDAASNDQTGALAPRSEIIPATGQWGRCGSVFDDVINDGMGTPGCDGQLDAAPANDCYGFRMVALESDIDPAANPGARWFVEAWYVIRDEVDIFSNMGWREIHPTWRGDLDPPRWTPGTTAQLGPFTQGSIVDLWLGEAALAERTARAVAASDEGQVLVAARVRREGGQWRYDYLVANHDLARAQTSGAEPDLRILSLDGLGAVRVTAANGATGTALAFADGDTEPANDWSAASGGDTSWTAPASTAQLAWGQLMGFSLLSDHPPGPGSVHLVHAAAGTPGSLAASSLVPDGERIFFDRFE